LTRQLDRHPIRLGQSSDHRRETWGEFGLRRTQVFNVCLGGQVYLEGVRTTVAPLSHPQGVPQRISCYLVEPGFDAIAVPQRRQVPHDPQKHFLKYIVGLNTRGYPAGEERPEWRREFLPHRQGVMGGGGCGARLPGRQRISHL
jgi:hypothetical protein